MREQLTTTINEQLNEATKRFTTGNDRVLDGVVETNRKVVDFAVKTADRFSSQGPTLPFADRLPTAAEAGERYLDVVERVVELNRDFNERVIKMLPVETAKKVTAKTAAAKPAAKKAPARTTTAKKTTAKKTTKKATARKATASK